MAVLSCTCQEKKGKTNEEILDYRNELAIFKRTRVIQLQCFFN